MIRERVNDTRVAEKLNPQAELADLLLSLYVPGKLLAL